MKGDCTRDLVQGSVGIDKAVNEGFAAGPCIHYASQEAHWDACDEHGHKLRARACQHRLQNRNHVKDSSEMNLPPTPLHLRKNQAETCCLPHLNPIRALSPESTPSNHATKQIKEDNDQHEML